MDVIPWDSDHPDDEELIIRNSSALLHEFQNHAPAQNKLAWADLQSWHSKIFQGVAVPVPYYIGNMRDSDKDLPMLFGYEVIIGAMRGVASKDVPRMLDRFFDRFNNSLSRIDQALPLNRLDAKRYSQILQLMSIAHGNWIRIHPFANGNGRTARALTNWIAARYDLPMLLSIKPRPSGNMYSFASQHSMSGDHSAMTRYIEILYEADI